MKLKIFPFTVDKKTGLYAAIFLVVSLLAVWAWSRSCRREAQPLDDGYSDLPAQISQIREMVKLSTLETDYEMVITDTVNSKVLCAVVNIHGVIGFDLEQMPTAMRGDTLYVQLPPEIISSYERGYRIIDSYSQRGWLGGKKPLMTTEENVIKQRIAGRFEDEMYERGYVEQARAQAVASLTQLLGSMNAHVVVIDRYPMGTRRKTLPDDLLQPSDTTRLSVPSPQ